MTSPAEDEREQWLGRLAKLLAGRDQQDKDQILRISYTSLQESPEKPSFMVPERAEVDDKDRGRSGPRSYGTRFLPGDTGC